MPYIYSDGAFTAIDIPGTTYAVATGVNNDGTVIGFAIDYDAYIRRGFTWRDGVLTWLDPLTANAYSDPESINDNGLIVGIGGFGATIWDQDLTAYSLNDLAGDPSIGGVIDAYSINDSDQIVGPGVSVEYPGQIVPFLLNPIAIPEPASAVILLAAFPLLAARRNYGRRK